jgi:hypothetical protein
MAGTTTNFAIPYPSVTDYVTDGATAMKSIADQVDAILFTGSSSGNLLINGAMQVSQRSAVGTAVTGITASNYYTADRFYLGISSLGTWTQTNIADAPTGSGLRNSIKMQCTTADASPAASDYAAIIQRIEGQNLQAIKKGTSSAQTMVLSFWVKAFQTGVYILNLYDYNNNRELSKSYTVTASATWQYVSIAIPADTTGAFTNDNATGLEVGWYLGAGSNFTSGTLNTTWNAANAANRLVGQTNVASSTNNYWQMTGAQLTIGSAVVPFQFKSFAEELQECQRYFIAYGGTQVYEPVLLGIGQSAGRVDFMLWLPVEMRTSPSAAITGNWQVSDSVSAIAVTSLTPSSPNTGNKSTLIIANVASGVTIYRPYRMESANSAAARLQLSAEL